MKYNISCLLEGANCRVVFVSDPKDSTDIENAVYEIEPRYKHEINKAFASVKKVGPFKIKNKKSIWKILKNTEAVDEEGLEFLDQQMKRIDLYYYADRSARALSNQQRMRASVLYETLNGRTYLLLNDCYATLDGKTAQNKGKDAFFNVASWIEKYPFSEFRGYDFIWITDMSVNEFFKHMGDNALNSDRYRYFIAENGSVTKLDADKLKGSAETAKSKEEEPKRSKQPGYTLEEFKEAFKKVDIKFDEEKPKPALTPYMSVVRVFHGNLGTMIVAHMIIGKISVQDKFKNDRTGKTYKTTSFRYINSIQNFDETANDYNAYLNEVDASKDSRMFVFFIEGSCDIQEGDRLIRVE